MRLFSFCNFSSIYLDRSCYSIDKFTQHIDTESCLNAILYDLYFRFLSLSSLCSKKGFPIRIIIINITLYLKTRRIITYCLFDCTICVILIFVGADCNWLFINNYNFGFSFTILIWKSESINILECIISVTHGIFHSQSLKALIN